jgi:DNA phosphorothioation-associated putative methyltransferase
MGRVLNRKALQNGLYDCRIELGFEDDAGTPITITRTWHFNDKGGSGSASIARHRTAISRSSLSTPMRALAQWGYLDGAPTVLDYGCGRGDDVRALCAAGVLATGWDPHFAPDAPREPSDVVNLGFVLNVIEDPDERSSALRAAFGLARRVLSVAVMLNGRGGGAEHADGVLTTRLTFQKYFGQAELRRPAPSQREACRLPS